MANKYLTLDCSPANGGALMTRTSAEKGGILSYTAKRDLRRDLDEEVRQEGYDYFWGNEGKPIVTFNEESILIDGQPYPNPNDTTEPITLVFLARRPNGQNAIIVGTPTKLWRFFSLEDGLYAEGDANGEYVSGDANGPYWELLTGSWILIGSGFVPVGPEFLQLHSGLATAVQEFNSSGTITASQASGSTAVVSSGAIFTAPMVGRFIRYSNGFVTKITSFIDATHVAVQTAPVIAVTALTFVVANYVVTANAAFFTPAMVGRQIRFDSGQVTQILEYLSPTTVRVADAPTVNIGPIHFRVLTGAHRWEAVTINGWTIFNNGADLPQVYRLEWSSVRPMYELREAGVARVGTIADYGGILMLGDITEIFSDKLLDNFALQDSGFITASQAGSTYSGLVTASQPAGGFTVTAGSPAVFDGSMDNGGIYIRFTNGFKALITAFIDGEHLTVDKAPTLAFNNLPYWIVNENSGSAGYSHIVNTSAGIFAPQMVGLNIVWDNGAVRLITQYVSPTRVFVDSDLSVPAGEFGIERRFGYGPYVFPYFNRIQFRIMWSLPGEPTRFGSVYKGTMGAGTFQLRLQFPQKSFVIGQEILVIGAGTAGGNLQAKIVYVSSLGQVLWLDTAAETAVTDANVVSADTVGTILGYEDLQDDGSGILRMMQLKTVLVILKDSSIFIARYTGLVDTPFEFSEPVPASSHKTIHYRWTLAAVESEWLIYAGRNAFFRFDLTNQIPLEIKAFDLCHDIFFNQADVDDTNEIFVADNAITKQLMFVFPSMTDDKMLVYDYKWGTTSTSSMLITAGATVKRPTSALAVGETEDWFVMGTGQGVVLLYGKVDKALPQWNNSKEIYYRRFAAPYSTTRSDYSSVLQSGLSHFGDQNTEKDVQEFLLYLGSQMAGGLAPTINFELFGARNLAEVKTALLSYVVPLPESNNLIPFFFRAHYFQSRITASGLDRNCRISGWAWRVSGVKSGSNIRRV